MTITELAIKRSTLVVVVFTALTMLGVLCYTKLNYELIPKIDVPVISISTEYSGASASEVESSITEQLEDALSSLENVKYSKSTSQEGSSQITIELVAGSNVSTVLQEAQRKVNGVLYKLPSDAKTPSLQSFSTEDIPVIKMGVTARMGSTTLYQLVKDQIKPDLSKLQGVGMVSLVGGDERQIKINVNREKLDAYHVSIAQIYNVVSSANQQFATGKIEGSRGQYTIRLSGKFSSLEDIRTAIVSRNQAGALVRIRDIAEVADGIAEYTSLNHINGESSIGIQVQKQSDANSVAVCTLVKKEIRNLEDRYSGIDMKFNVASDNSVFTLASAESVLEDLGIAICLVATVMFFFLHSYRNSLIVLVSIPTSLISVFTGMYIFNFSLNLMTLMGLSLVIGILVDDSIVVLENIHRHLLQGKDRVTAALDGRNEIGFTAAAITMVDVVVFVPMALVSGMIGNILREFALVVVFSTLMSLFVSFTVTPLLASRFSKVEHLTRGTLMGRIALSFESLYNALVERYEKILLWGLDRRRTVYVIVSVMFFASLFLVGFNLVGSEFMPNNDRGEFTVKLEGEAQNTIYQTVTLTQKVERLLLSKPEVTTVFSNIGYSSSGMVSGGSEQHKSEITVQIVDKKKRKPTVEQYAAMTKKEILDSIPGVKVSSVPASMFGSSEAPIQILLRGTDMNELYAVADSISGAIKGIPGVNDIRLSVERSKPEMRVELNREKMAMLGISVADVGNALQVAFAGNTQLKYSEGGTDYDINVKLDQFDRSRVEDISSIGFVNSKGENVQLRQFASVYQALGPTKLERYDRMSCLTVTSEVFGRPVGTVGEEIKALLARRINSRTVTIEYKGSLERQSEAFGSLFTALAAAILLVYFVMVSLYNSYLYPFVVLFSLPVAIIGALLALALSGQNLSIYSLIGIIMLMGLVAKNAILLVDFTNNLRQRGHGVMDALVEAGKERLRSILMTTIAMVFGMLPLATATGISSESKNGLAWAIIGGLLSSLMLTLVLVPAVYATMESLKGRLRGWVQARRRTRTLPASSSAN